MSEDNKLVVLNNEQSLAAGGLGFGDSISLGDIKPAYMQLVKPSSTQEGAKPGMFRDSSTGEHFESIDVVLMFAKEQRGYYDNSTGKYSKEQLLCFSHDCQFPHNKSRQIQNYDCATCDKGDVNWEIWKKNGKQAKFLPPCKKYWHTYVVVRQTQLPYYLDIKGKDITSFTQFKDMFKRIAQQQTAFVANENKKLKAEGKPLLPAPSITDFVFNISSRRDGAQPVMVFSKPLLMKEEDRKAFGAIFLNTRERFEKQVSEEPQEAATAETEIEAPKVQENTAVLGQNANVQPEEKITI